MRLLLVIAFAGILSPQQGPPWRDYDRTPAFRAEEFVGKTRAVCGSVLSANRVGTGNKASTELRLDVTPALTPLTVVVSPDVRREFGEGFDERARGFDVCVLGTVKRKADGLQMTVDSVEDIRATIRPGRQTSAVSDFAPGVARPKESGVQWPTVKREVKPKYTAMAMRARLAGAVELEAVVLVDGTIGAVRVTKSLDALYGLDDAAVIALKGWTFAPATRDGRPTEVVVPVVLEFRLSTKK